ncbi:MAG: phosphatidylglycerophosphatase A [Chloroflexi bacterium]|nr:phosphatidylglycerophosphatase A [Chloroflexota bacterium]MYE42104.1 phosphatidylglycerophosphatase A [Chloroflexota bacterium]
MLNRLAKPGSVLGWLFGTALGLGLFPIAPATLASLVAVAVYYPLPMDGDSPAFIALVAASLAIGPWACNSLTTADDPDPKRAVWDEVAGVWLTCLFLPKTLPWLAAAFVVFRVLDVLKPWPIRRFERLPGGWGIMADDAAAGIAGAALLNLVYRLGW